MNFHRLRKFSKGNNLLKFRFQSTFAKTDSEVDLLPKQDPKVTRNVTGITVASVENYSPVSYISVLVKAGSRYETGNNLGIAHCLRNCTSLSTRNRTAFNITRSLEVYGAKLGVTSTREHIMYTLQCIRDDLDNCLELLADVATQPAFKPWEVSDASSKILTDLALHENNPESVLMEAVHDVAFRGGLANSLYMQPFMVGKHTSEMLHDFVRDRFTASNTSVIGLGIDHDQLENSVTKLFNVSDHNPASNGVTKFGGGEVRILADIPYTHTAIVAEGAGLINTKEMLSLGVLQNILGTGIRHKHSESKFSKLGEAAAKCTDHPFAVSSMNINYSDTGLFGVYIAGCPDDMQQMVKSIVSQMRGVTKNISEDSVQTAKHMLKAKIRLEREMAKDAVTEMAIETANFGQIRKIEDVERLIDDLKTSDISSIAGKVMKTKPAMATVGPLHSTPHIDELI